MTINPNSLSRTAVITFSDEFDTFQTWNGSTGFDTTGGPQWAGRVTASGTLPYNNELQWYVRAGAVDAGGTTLPNPFSVSDGILTITARPADSALRTSLQGQRFTSGVITTEHDFSQTYGYFEMRAQMPGGQGFWPAFWLLPTDGRWPPELDVMEMLGHQTSTLHTTAHSQIQGQSRIASHYQSTAAVGVADMTTGFHTYGVGWQSDTITWYFDGQRVFQAATPADMHVPMYMVANLAVGGDWPGAPDASTVFPGSMRIDYIRAYANRTDEPVPIFARDGYLAANPGVVQAGGDAVAHHRTYGWREGRDPSASFDDQLYLLHNPDVRAAGIDPFTHYLDHGRAEGRDTHAAIGRSSDIAGGFDAEFYLLGNADVARAAITAGGDSFAFARTHFANFGAREGRDPNAVFDTDAYLAAYADVRASGLNPLTHYDQFGFREGRDPSTGFDTTAYLAANADVRAAGIDPMQHYLQFGIYEGRSPHGDGTLGGGSSG